jgi:hypothetical protein
MPHDVEVVPSSARKEAFHQTEKQVPHRAFSPVRNDKEDGYGMTRETSMDVSTSKIDGT